MYPTNPMYPAHPVFQTCSFLAAENMQMRYALAAKDTQIANQQQQIVSLQKEVDSLRHDAQRWARFKAIIDGQKGEMTSSHLQNIVDHGNREGKSE